MSSRTAGVAAAALVTAAATTPRTSSGAAGGPTDVEVTGALATSDADTEQPPATARPPRWPDLLRWAAALLAGVALTRRRAGTG